MKYDIKVKLNNKDYFDSSMNKINYSYTKFLDIFIFSASLLYMFFSIYNKSFFTFTTTKKIMIVFIILLFPIIQPLFIFLKIIIKSKNRNEINLSFTNDNIIISSNDESITVEYCNVYNFIKYKNMIVIMYDSIHGQIIPNRYLGTNVDSFYDFVSCKIIEARKSVNEQM